MGAGTLAHAQRTFALPPAPQTVRPGPASAPTATPSTDLRSRFGTELAARLIRSTDPDDRLRGLQRVAATHTQEALAILERALEREGAARADSRALLAVVRGLATWTDRERARKALQIVVDPTQVFDARPIGWPTRDPAADDIEGAARVVLARQEAAIALAESGRVHDVEALIALARTGSAGQAAALDALAIHPPELALLTGVTLTTAPMIALAVGTGDLRALDTIFGAVRASDPSLRAAALVALGRAGDSWRTSEVAHAALRDPGKRASVSQRPRLWSRLAARDASQAVEALIADDATALAGLQLGQDVSSEGVTKAATARVAATADPGVRAAAVATLGRQTSPAAVGALTTFVADPRLQGDAMAALARSANTSAMGALETLGRAPATRRLAARAYFVRRFTRGDRSVVLDAALATLAAARDGADRALGTEALVALGEKPLEGALGDADARVRRAVAMGAMARLDERTRHVLLMHLSVETDEPTRQVLARWGLRTVMFRRSSPRWHYSTAPRPAVRTRRLPLWRSPDAPTTPSPLRSTRCWRRTTRF